MSGAEAAGEDRGPHDTPTDPVGEGAPGAPVGGARAEVLPGRYRHYKGPEYEVLFEARHSETEEVLVVYRALYGERGLWVRPKAMWLETVEVDGEAGPRFRRIAAPDEG